MPSILMFSVGLMSFNACMFVCVRVCVFWSKCTIVPLKFCFSIGIERTSRPFIPSPELKTITPTTIAKKRKNNNKKEKLVQRDDDDEEEEVGAEKSTHRHETRERERATEPNCMILADLTGKRK